jgi:hypothetical protein
MRTNLPLHCGGRTLAALALALVGGPLAAQELCPAAPAKLLEGGWQAYRTDSLDLAAARFAPIAQCGVPGGLIGLGFVALRRSQLSAADSLFNAALRRDSAQVDAWEGVARVAWRRGDARNAARAAIRALNLAPDRADLRLLLDEADPDWIDLP